MKKQADAREGGYSLQDVLLVHLHISGLVEECVSIVVPKGRRNDVLKLAHSSLLGGHLSIRNTLINRSFTWSGMVKGKKEWCSLSGLSKGSEGSWGEGTSQTLTSYHRTF